ncbi:hypothetical protein [Salsipaludibacter albus]|uniref:hypothetical protein n=1 Tax=Salsipaludibacter albus TaxID=2849650 RepID=UPI001EE3D3CB|nr:hypothetical protein [Salsipaludibacter albus]
MTDDAVHAERRDPEQPEGALDLHAAGAELLEQANGLAAGRAARTLTPHLGADLKQTLLAVCAGQRLGEHPSPGPATLQVLSGAVTVHVGDDALSLDAGEWAVLPRELHDLAARDDAVVLLTVHADPTT